MQDKLQHFHELLLIPNSPESFTPQAPDIRVK